MGSKQALVLFSGGQDSATCLIWALKNFDQVATIGYSYGQRHFVELECRLEFLSRFKDSFPDLGEHLLEDMVLNLGFISELGRTALTHDESIVSRSSGFPNTFVPGRNVFFLSSAAAIAYQKEINHLVGGMCETDFSGYPDCRQDTIDSLQITLNKAMETQITIHTPLMQLSKGDTWRLIEQWGGEKLVKLMVEFTHTCYEGTREQLHEWGYGCQQCPACELRRKGYEQYRNGAAT